MIYLRVGSRNTDVSNLTKLFPKLRHCLLLHYQPIATTRNQEIRNMLTCWQKIHVSPTGSEWLKDNVSMNFDTIPSLYVWSLVWLSQVLESHIQLNAIVTFCCGRHLRVSHVFSCLFRQLYINQCKFHIISSSHSTCTTCTIMYYKSFNTMKIND